MAHRPGSGLALLLVVVAAAGGPAGAEPPAITVGVQLPLSGERAALGPLIRNSVEVAVDDVNRRGAAGGARLAAVFVDDGDSRAPDATEGNRNAARKIRPMRAAAREPGGDRQPDRRHPHGGRAPRAV